MGVASEQAVSSRGDPGSRLPPLVLVSNRGPVTFDAAGERTGNALPPCPCETSASYSFIAEAIQVALRYDARPVSAVTRPPEPRCTSPPAWKVTGPRLLTSTSGARCAGAWLMPSARGRSAGSRAGSAA